VTTVLVTGGAGFIGSHLCDRLLAEGHRVVAVDDLSTGRIANLSEARGYGNEFTFFNMDVRADGLVSLFERHRPEVVMHVAAQASVSASLLGFSEATNRNSPSSELPIFRDRRVANQRAARRLPVSSPRALA